MKDRLFKNHHCELIFGGQDTYWTSGGGNASVIAPNLIAEGLIKPSIIVMPNCEYPMVMKI